MRRLVALAILFCIGCTPETDNSSTPTPNPNPTLTAITDPESFQAIADERRERETHPGKALFDQSCAACHNGNLKKAPHRDMIGLMTPEAILNTMTNGIMKNEAAALNDQDKRAVAEYLSGDALGGELASIPSCKMDLTYQSGLSSPGFNWGLQLNNQRNISAKSAGLSSTNINELETAWAVAMPGANRVRSQPVFAGGLVLVGSHDGNVYALDPDSGCQVWSFQASGEVRTGIAIDESFDIPMAFFGDVLANVYGINAATGELVWRMRADEHPNATITGSPTPHNGRLYIPVSSLEVSLAIDPNYECCTFRGSVVAVDAPTGKQLWKTYTIENPPSVSGKNPVGTNILGPSGAVIWNSPSIDEATNQLFVGTGENMSSPASLTSDALIAIDLDSGEINWVFQATANDVWNGACDTSTPENCPVEGGPDFDFGGATLITNTTKHGPLVIAGQKSGVVHAINPKSGELVWQTKVGRGGIQGGIHFGIAASGQTLLIPISDMADGRTYPDPDRPGMHALDANTGEILWSTLHDDQCGERAHCHPGISQVVTVIGDLVLGGAMDGKVRAYRIADGQIIWELDTTADQFDTITGEPGIGGSLGGASGPVAHDGLLLISSGYGIYNHMAGNLLLALRVPSATGSTNPE